MPSSDETYLEAFVETLGTLPYETRRNLELIRDLDQSCGADLQRLRALHERFLQAAETKILQLQVVQNAAVTGKPGATTGVRVLGSNEEEAAPVILPTTDELIKYCCAGNQEQWREIVALQEQCLQKADEKVSVAQQAYELIDARVARIDEDLAAMEKLLQSTGEFNAGVAAKPNELAACQVTPGSEWILAKVIEHDTKTGMYQLSDEDIESNKIFHLPQDQVVVLRGVERLVKGDSVFAVYPDTTSFYQASVVSAPRKTTGASSQFVMVNFVDDSDEFGVTHDKAVPLKHVMMPPFGTVLE